MLKMPLSHLYKSEKCAPILHIINNFFASSAFCRREKVLIFENFRAESLWKIGENDKSYTAIPHPHRVNTSLQWTTSLRDHWSFACMVKSYHEGPLYSGNLSKAQFILQAILPQRQNYPISVLVTSLFVTLAHSDWMPLCHKAMPLEVWSELNTAAVTRLVTIEKLHCRCLKHSLPGKQNWQTARIT